MCTLFTCIALSSSFSTCLASPHSQLLQRAAVTKHFHPEWQGKGGGGQEGLHCARTGDGHVRGEARGGSDNLESLLIYSAVISLLSLHCQFVFPFVGAILQHGNDGSVQALSQEHEWNEEARYKLYSKWKCQRGNCRISVSNKKEELKWQSLAYTVPRRL